MCDERCELRTDVFTLVVRWWRRNVLREKSSQGPTAAESMAQWKSMIDAEKQRTMQANQNYADSCTEGDTTPFGDPYQVLPSKSHPGSGTGNQQ